MDSNNTFKVPVSTASGKQVFVTISGNKIAVASNALDAERQVREVISLTASDIVDKVRASEESTFVSKIRVALVKVDN